VSPIVSSIRYLLLSSDPNDRVEGVANSSAQSRKTSVSLRLFLFLCVPAGEHALAVTTAQRSHLFSEVNDRIYDLLESADADLPGEFLCECGDECGRRVVLLPQEFLELREAGGLVRSPDCAVAADGVPALG
jgi:hypothetical protein